NILNNAQQAIDGEGKIFVKTHQEGETVCVSIRDTGRGIAAHLRSKIFDPFFTTKAPGEGTGLGLSLSYGLLKKLGGTIECKSTVGKGTEFIVKFPAKSEAQETSDASLIEPTLVEGTV